MARLRVAFDETTGMVTFSNAIPPALPPDVSLTVTIYYPDGFVQTLPLVLNTGNSYQYSMRYRRGQDGRLLTGAYRFTAQGYDGDEEPSGSLFDRSVDISLPGQLVVSQDLRPLEPYLSLSDDTVHSLDGYTLQGSVSRSWEWERGSDSGTGINQEFPLSLGGAYYSGTYSWSLSVTASFSKGDDMTSLVTERSISGELTVENPIMIPQIQELLNCLLSKFIDSDCCDTAAAKRQKDDYQCAVSIFHSFIVNGQAGITDGQTERLSKILAILRKHGCVDDGTIADTLLSAYDWCLCDEGGGGGGSRGEYAIGTGVFISTDAPEGSGGFTYSAAAGVGTITQVNSGVRIFTGTVSGDSDDATHTSNGATDSFKLVLPTSGAVNTSYLNAMLAGISVWGAQQSNPTASNPWVKDAGSVQVRITDISSNSISIVFAGIGATYPSGWAVNFICP